MSNMKTIKELSPEKREDLLGILNARFEKNMNRHKGLKWSEVQLRLEADSGKLLSLYEMERTGGEPDEIRKLGGALFCDRRYDHVFVYHNGAGSYYGVRGFRGSLSV